MLPTPSLSFAAFRKRTRIALNCSLRLFVLLRRRSVQVLLQACHECAMQQRKEISIEGEDLTSLPLTGVGALR